VTTFSIHGSLHGNLPGQITVGTKYPESDLTYGLGDYGVRKTKLRYEEFPVSITITQGGTVFVQDDIFTFDTYAASYFTQDIGQILRG
jgi:hypothetical protein